MSDNYVMLNWTPDKRDRLVKVLRREPLKSADNSHVFDFEGGKYLVGYAKYLIEYLNTRMPKSKPKTRGQRVRKASSK